MGFVGSLFSGSQGMGWQPERAASPEQAQQLYQQQQQRLAQQQAFTQALQAQTPGAIAAQQQILGQLQQQAQGLGPSVARGMLAEQTGQNVAQTAALMGGQRGASANAGLIARQAATAGMGAQQQAAGQAATLRAQEQLGAQQAAAGLAGRQIGQVSQAQEAGLQAQTAAQQNVLNAIAQRNAAQAGIQQQVAGGQQQMFGGLLGGAAQLGAAAVGLAEGGEVPSSPKIGEKGYWKKIQEEHGKITSPQQKQAEPLREGAYQMGTALGALAGKLLGGSKSPTGQTTGGYAGANLGVDTSMPSPVNPMATSQTIGAYQAPNLMPQPGMQKMSPGLGVNYAEGGQVPAMLSPGERYLPPSEVEKVKEGKKEAVSAGKKIPGKAKVDGDSLKNDTVPANLEEGGIVIPRSVMQSKDPAEQARKFVAAIVAKQQMKRK